jgi:hypothetical protein
VRECEAFHGEWLVTFALLLSPLAQHGSRRTRR